MGDFEDLEPKLTIAELELRRPGPESIEGTSIPSAQKLISELTVKEWQTLQAQERRLLISELIEALDTRDLLKGT